MTHKTYAEMTSRELNNLRYQLAMKYDDEMRDIFDGTSEMYDESDLEYWDELIHKIDDTLRERPIENPHVGFTRGYAGDPDNGKPGKVYWRCEVEDDAWIRFSYFYYETEQEARDAFAGWCKEKNIDPAGVPEKVTILS